MICSECGKASDDSFPCCPFCVSGGKSDDRDAVIACAQVSLDLFKKRTRTRVILMGITVFAFALVAGFIFPTGRRPPTYESGDKILEYKTVTEGERTDWGGMGVDYDEINVMVPTKWQDAETGKIYSLDDEYRSERSYWEEIGRIKFKILWAIFILATPVMAIAYLILVHNEKRFLVREYPPVQLTHLA